MVDAPVSRTWECWTDPAHIVQWNFAIDTWHAPHATNDLRVGGSFSCRMEAKDGSMGFDFGGIYDEVVLHKRISYHLGDKRTVAVTFSEEGKQTRVVEIFDTEDENSAEMQRQGWQSILNNFKKHVESQH